MSRGWLGSTRGRGKWVSGWNSPLQDMVQYGHVPDCSQSSVICFSYTLSASSQSFNDFIKRGFSFLRSAGNLERQKCVLSRRLIKHSSWSGRRSRVLSPRGPVGSSGCCLLGCGAGWDLRPRGKSDQQKPQGNWAPAFSELALLKPGVKSKNRSSGLLFGFLFSCLY